MVITNWAGNVTFSARRLHRPASVAEVRELVADADNFRVLGSGHSFNPIADTTGDLISLADLPPVISISSDSETVTVSAGLRYGEVVPRLHAAGYALHNLGSLPHISIAGACATGTHGSGVANGTLASAVVALDLVTADGGLRTITRDDELFPAGVVSLGALGVVTSLTLALRPTFDMAQYVYDDLPYAAALDEFDAIMSSAYSVSLFTDWAGPHFNQVWVKQLASAPAPPKHWHGATLADAPRHPVPGMSAESCTPQLGEPGPWHARLPHFKLEFTPSSGEELQSEYFVPRDQAILGLAALHRLRDRIAPVLQISEIRTIAADDLWLSPSYGRDTVAFHFTWVKDTEAVLPVLREIEAALAPFDARPHWGKLFTMPPEVVATRYGRLADFAALTTRLDPNAKLQNPFLTPHLHP
ncbi:FAD-binding protein [Phytohabitans aurantiacus]|uniref:FAD-binding protein n=1 Tax=Phytohabitans aurantiacus TaxID=3016789 RepID=UPI0024902F4F|nr:FAD-binding protein [Phytohabitans aurantiacus]